MAKSGKPNHIRLTPEPGYLALGVIAMSLLRGLERGPTICLTTQQLPCLLVSSEFSGCPASPYFSGRRWVSWTRPGRNLWSSGTEDKHRRRYSPDFRATAKALLLAKAREVD